MLIARPQPCQVKTKEYFIFLVLVCNPTWKFNITLNDFVKVATVITVVIVVIPPLTPTSEKTKRQAHCPVGQHSWL